ncbi:MAG: ribonuclease R family protein [Planctomycetota bacterium]
MPSRFTERIVNHLAHAGYAPAPIATIATDMRVPEDALDEFAEAVRRLEEAGRVIIGRDRLLRLPRFGDEVVGRFKLNQRGFGFVRPEQTFEEGDLFIPPDAVRDAITGDRVRARVIRRPQGRGRPDRRHVFGRIEEVLERGQEHFVGVLAREGGEWFVHPDGQLLAEPVVIRDPHAKNAKVGDKVVIELLHYPTDHYLPEGVIIRVLGEAGRPDVETEAVIAAHGLRTEFPEAAIQTAREAAASIDEMAEQGWPGREDITGTFTFTIDPPDAKDFDDAISIEHDAGSGRWTLGVHIADVAHFVRQDSALDEEATQRGNSVYLPRLVIPMLPEVLSNGVCSLQEGVPRLAKSVFVTFDEKGNVQSQRLAATVIRSDKRLTYLEAQALIDGDLSEARKHARTEPNYDDRLVETLRKSNQLAGLLRRRRLRDGMIVLNLPEVELVFDEDGHVVDAHPEDGAFTHTIIEMFMVEANEAVARTFSGLTVPLIRRIHPDPVFGDLEELRMYARVAHYKLPEAPTRHDLQRLLQKTHETPAARAIHFAVLRTLTKASYSPAMIGHYALASDHYAHFTSPIRRYPDLLVHRVVEAYLQGTENGRSVPGGRKRDRFIQMLLEDSRVLDEGRLLELGRHLSDTEKEAEAAEESLRDFLVLQYLHDHRMGEDFTGVVTGVMGRGVFVSIEQFLVEGMVSTRDLPQPGGRVDRWVVSDQTGRLVSRKSGLSVGIGDIVTVRIVAIDVASRQMDLQLTTMPVQMQATRGPREEDAPQGGKSHSKRAKGGRSAARQRRGRR